MQEFKILKTSGTYAETLEAYGLANLIEKIYSSLNIDDNTKIIDKGQYYSIIAETALTEEMLNGLNYFHVLNYIARKDDDLPEGMNYHDNFVFRYKEQKALRENRKKESEEVYKKYSGKEKEHLRRKRLKEIEDKYSGAGAAKIDIEYDVYSQASTPNQLKSFNNIFNNIYLNKDYFNILISDILKTYSEKSGIKYFKLLKTHKLKGFSKEITATQLYNPNQGKGLNKPKATGINGFNFKPSWISELLKTSGAFNSMICQLVKIGSNYDLKVFVPEFNDVQIRKKQEIINNFKKNLKGNTPVKIDILNILILIKKLLENSEKNKDYFGKARNRIKGLHSVYQKDLGQNKAVSNIAFIQTPGFIEINNQNNLTDWLGILNEQISIIADIEEMGSSVQALLEYRNFINASHLYSFFNFSFWYATYLMQSLASEKFYIKPFTYKTLTKFYKNMDKEKLNLIEIIENEGFKAVAKAIKNSTVSLQYAKSRGEKLKFGIRYGIAQTLQNKSKSKKDLTEFIGEFITTYNSETSHYKENNPDFKDRALVKTEELTAFFSLLEKYPKSSKVIGALLGSYGFATNKKDKHQKNNDKAETNNNN